MERKITHLTKTSRQHQQSCFNKNELCIILKSFLTFCFKHHERVLFLLLALGNRNLIWYCDFLGRWEKLNHEKCITESQRINLNPVSVPLKMKTLKTTFC